MVYKRDCMCMHVPVWSTQNSADCITKLDGATVNLPILGLIFRLKTPIPFPSLNFYFVVCVIYVEYQSHPVKWKNSVTVSYCNLSLSLPLLPTPFFIRVCTCACIWCNPPFIVVWIFNTLIINYAPTLCNFCGRSKQFLSPVDNYGEICCQHVPICRTATKSTGRGI